MIIILTVWTDVRTQPGTYGLDSLLLCWSRYSDKTNRTCWDKDEMRTRCLSGAAAAAKPPRPAPNPLSPPWTPANFGSDRGRNGFLPRLEGRMTEQFKPTVRISQTAEYTLSNYLLKSVRNVGSNLGRCGRVLLFPRWITFIPVWNICTSWWLKILLTSHSNTLLKFPVIIFYATDSQLATLGYLNVFWTLRF